ncbi:hypothetical protein MP228_008046 [Amoeboaphelidium protococcarum]|nr:hypothetical protein MP228_008046 [Amoeboaphelidium protococcarum]
MQRYQRISYQSLRVLACRRTAFYSRRSTQNGGDTGFKQQVYDAVPIGKNQGLTSQSPSAEILQRPALAIGRQLEMINVMLGYEQANKYAIYDASTAQNVGFIVEDAPSILSVLSRQVLRTHRPFTANVLSASGQSLLTVRRPFQFINSRIYVHDEFGEVIGEVQQRWHLWRRRYDLFVGKKQFGLIDAPFLSWQFHVLDEDSQIISTIDKNFTGFAREIFTDTSTYILRMDTASGQDESVRRDFSTSALSLQQRAVLLACAISIDFDYFSRKSGHGGLFGWYPLWGGWGGED